MRLDPIIAKIAALDLFRVVEGAASFTAAQGRVKTFPTAFVVPLAERAGANAFDIGAVSQRVEISFGVIVALRAVTGAGERGVADLDDIRKLLLADMIGWVHPDMDRETTYAGGRVVSMTGGQLWWEFDFNTGETLRKT